ncbi:MAG: hypothetical protein JWQ42_3576 [Edaphobacter sp.]|jgi:hypothetical protein|nr:hypothetical protein [Edaphobacter sp.]
MVAFTVMMVAFSVRGSYPEFSLSASAIWALAEVQRSFNLASLKAMSIYGH